MKIVERRGLFSHNDKIEILIVVKCMNSLSVLTTAHEIFITWPLCHYADVNKVTDDKSTHSKLNKPLQNESQCVDKLVEKTQS